MRLIQTSTLEVKKSKFLGYLFEIDNEHDVKIIIDQLRAEHKKLRHIPFAYYLGNTAGKTDDKEPHNTAGIQLLNILNRNDLDSHLLVVVRYYGGTKLGAGNLLRAYSRAGNLCVTKNK